MGVGFGGGKNPLYFGKRNNIGIQNGVIPRKKMGKILIRPFLGNVCQQVPVYIAGFFFINPGAGGSCKRMWLYKS